MRRQIGLGLLIVLNLIFIYIIIMGSGLTFALIVAPLGQERGHEIANLTTNELLIKVGVVSFIFLLINYFITKKMMVNKKPLLTSLTVTLFGIIVFIPYFLSSRKSFLDYQNGTSQLQHYIDRQTITAAAIISHSDTFQVTKLDDFLRDIGNAKYIRGPLKYAKKIKLVFKRTDGGKDSIFTNGHIYGVYKEKYFLTDQNIIDKYLDK